jgi:hypothetical protein
MNGLSFQQRDKLGKSIQMYLQKKKEEKKKKKRKIVMKEH